MFCEKLCTTIILCTAQPFFFFLVCIRAKVMLRLNLYQKYGLCNGAVGYVRDIIYDEVMVRVKVVLPLLF